MIEGAVHFQFAIATGEGAWNRQLSTADQSNRTRKGGAEFGMRANSVAMDWMSKHAMAPLLSSVAKSQSRAFGAPTNLIFALFDRSRYPQTASVVQLPRNCNGVAHIFSEISASVARFDRTMRLLSSRSPSAYGNERMRSSWVRPYWPESRRRPRVRASRIPKQRDGLVNARRASVELGAAP